MDLVVANFAMLDDLSRTRSLTDAESRRLERLMRSLDQRDYRQMRDARQRRREMAA